MTIPKVHTIQATNTWELIETTYDQDGFTFWSNGNIEYAGTKTPNTDEIIPILQDQEFGFQKPQSFRVRGTAGTKIFLSPFDV